jgi:hypothetical protein
MTNQSGIKKVVASAVLAGAFSLTSLFGGIASADTPNSDVDLSNLTIQKEVDRSVGGDGAFDGADFLVWQLGDSPSPTADVDYTHVDLHMNIWIN